MYSTTISLFRKVLAQYFKDAKTLMDEEFKSSTTDSGFLSSHLTSSSDLPSEEIRSDSGIIDDYKREDARLLMRLDSGVDNGLSETFSGLCLKNSNINNLNSTKTKLHEDDSQQRTEKESLSPWEIYYRQDVDGDTQLHISVIHSFVEATDALIRLAPYPCLLDIPNDMSQTPMHLAVLTRQPRVVRRLLVAGANPAARDLRGNTPMHLACLQGDIDSVRAMTAPVSIDEVKSMDLQYETIVRTIDVEQRNYEGQMCVHLATLGGHVEVLRNLVWLGANINSREGKSGYTPLHYAIELGNKNIVKFLLSECKQLQLEVCTYAGRTALQLAPVDSQIVQALRAKGALLPVEESDDDEYDTDSSDEMPFESTNVFNKPSLVINASA